MPPSKAIIERNGKILADYLAGNATMAKIAEKYNIPAGTVGSVIKSARARLLPDTEKIQSVVAKKMEERISEAMERQIDLGEKLIKKATDSAKDITIENATELSTMARTGVDIARKGYGIKDDDNKITAIQINLSSPINLGGDIVGTITTQESNNDKETIPPTIIQTEEK